MNEYLIGYTAVGSIVGLALGCLLYMIGGRAHKWIRRFLGSLVIATTVNISAVIMGVWNPLLTLVYPCLILGFVQGYGGDTLEVKIARRAVFALTTSLSGLVCCIAIGGATWYILPLHVCVTLFTIYLGVISKVRAAAEEVFICLLLNTGLIIYPFINV